ncbi:MAG: methyltransferase domain-containing protein [Candidatus Promineifilaceae bacterium]|nr:methyltransferase domain-containing protein [Candidatus Promineifilaceae bacterium]
MAFEKQDLRAKRAESRRPRFGKNLIGDGDLRADSLARASLARRDLADLAARGIRFSPFLEIGASRAQRSAILSKDYQAEGVATDISLPSLQDAPYTQLLLGVPAMPLTICCDMHHLPFRDDTFQFIFAYRTLHHVPNPIPVVAECYRVLGRGGHFFCNEEPMLGPLLRLLRGQRTLSHPYTPLQRLAARYRLEKVFWDDGAWERSVGIVEARFNLNLWRQALAPFTRVETTISRRLRLQTDLRTPSLSRWLARIVGGNVRALCYKDGGVPPPENFMERLLCLDCGGAPVAQAEDGSFRCPTCRRRYPLHDGVLVMLPRRLQETLYPSLADEGKPHRTE